LSNLVFVSGDYCSGSTLLYTLFRKSEKYYSIYEPLHERLLEYLIWPMAAYDHHFFVGDYHATLKGFRRIPALFDPRWGNTGLYMDASARNDAMLRYLNYVIGTAFGQAPRVMLKENRFAFRLGWIRANFPKAKIVHIYRDKDAQWRSILRRVRQHLGRTDVGENDVNFRGFAIAFWCEDLKTRFPELDARHFKSGYERFCKLWELSLSEQQMYADLSINYWDLTHSFENTCDQLWRCIGASDVDNAELKRFVIAPEEQQNVPVSALNKRLGYWVDRIGRRYARERIRARTYMQSRTPSVRPAGQ
jgi:sulfotransferase family protein